MKPNEAIKAISNLNTLKDLYFENSEPYNSIILAIQALESVSKLELPRGVKLCDCPECGAEIQFGISEELKEKLKNIKLRK